MIYTKLNKPCRVPFIKLLISDKKKNTFRNFNWLEERRNCRIRNARDSDPITLDPWETLTSWRTRVRSEIVFRKNCVPQRCLWRIQWSPILIATHGLQLIFIYLLVMYNINFIFLNLKKFLKYCYVKIVSFIFLV